MDMVVHDTLRFYSPVGMNTRTCTADVTLPGTDISLKKMNSCPAPCLAYTGIPSTTPTPTPSTPSTSAGRRRLLNIRESTTVTIANSGRLSLMCFCRYAFQAFGQGPRACIGQRFALLEMKTAVLQVWRNYSFLPSDNNQVN